MIPLCLDTRETAGAFNHRHGWTDSAALSLAREVLEDANCHEASEALRRFQKFGDTEKDAIDAMKHTADEMTQIAGRWLKFAESMKEDAEALDDLANSLRIQVEECEEGRQP